MREKISHLKGLIGKTPIIKLNNEKFNLYVKLEQYNFSGSIKDRAVNNILHQGIIDNKINEQTIIIESSSGNFAYSAALHCKFLGIKFIAVVDPNINVGMLERLKLLCHEVIMVSVKDATGGYLLNRIATIKKLVEDNEHYFWTNQYSNVNNYLAYSELTYELVAEVKDIDYIFVAVSTTGTIKGISESVKEINKDIKIIAVDIRGSMIFSDEKYIRSLPGIGASKKSEFLNQADIYDYIIIEEDDIIVGCQELLKEGLFLGGSSGACYKAVHKYYEKNLSKNSEKKNFLFLSPDGGNGYLNNVYK